MYLYFSIGGASPGNQHCPNCISTLSFPTALTPAIQSPSLKYFVGFYLARPAAALQLARRATAICSAAVSNLFIFRTIPFTPIISTNVPSKLRGCADAHVTKKRRASVSNCRAVIFNATA